jgi:hypothetical protein
MTDDPGTPGGHHWELNTGVTLVHEAGTTLLELPLADANYGVGERLQLKLEVPLRVQTHPGTKSGLGMPVVGVKWRFLDQTESGLSISTYPQLEFRSPILPLRNSDDDGSSLFLPLELARSWGPFGINGEVGYRMVNGGPHELGYGLALGYAPAATLELLSECNGSYEQASSATELICQMGARQEVGPHLTMLGAVGSAVARANTERREIQAYLGLQSRW